MRNRSITQLIIGMVVARSSSRSGCACAAPKKASHNLDRLSEQLPLRSDCVCMTFGSRSSIDVSILFVLQRLPVARRIRTRPGLEGAKVTGPIVTCQFQVGQPRCPTPPGPWHRRATPSVRLL